MEPSIRYHIGVISQTVEYALRAVVDLSYHFGESRTTQEIARATKVPPDYLAKILKDLSRHGVVRGRRGLGGGFTLTRDPKQMSIYEVIAAVDPPQRIMSCPLKLDAHRDRLCPLHQKLDSAMAIAEEAFRSTTIADVTGDPSNQPLRRATRTELTVSGGLLPVAPSKAGTTGKRKRR